MKCIEYYNPNKRIVRVSDKEAQAAVASGKVHYIPKKKWKKQVRDAEDLTSKSMKG